MCLSIIWLFCKAKFQLLINARRKLNAQFFATCLDWRRQARESSLATHIYIVVNCEMMLIMFLSDCFTSAYVGCAGAFHVQGFSLHLEEALSAPLPLPSLFDYRLYGLGVSLTIISSPSPICFVPVVVPMPLHFIFMSSLVT